MITFVFPNRHPYVVLFHLGFRAAAILVYLFCGWFSDGFVTSFVFTVILLALDFWTVKNITGLWDVLKFCIVNRNIVVISSLQVEYWLAFGGGVM